MSKKNGVKIETLNAFQKSQIIAAAGALGCFEEKSSASIAKELMVMDPEKKVKKETAVLKNSFGVGHGSVGDQNYFSFSLEDLPRLATLFLCSPEYLAHLQQSLRRAKASRGFYLSDAIKNSPYLGEVQEVLNNSFLLYEKLVSFGVPAEDARYLLPLYTKTNIQTVGNARELCHLLYMSEQPNVPSIVKNIVKEMIKKAKINAKDLFTKYGFNFEPLSWYPSAQLFGNEYIIKFNTFAKSYPSLLNNDVIFDKNKLVPKYFSKAIFEKAIKKKDESALSLLKHIHFEFICEMSLAAWHQAIRQRTWNHSVQSIYDAASIGFQSVKVSNKKMSVESRMVIPASVVKVRMAEEYIDQHNKMINLYRKLGRSGMPKSEAIGVVPHSLKVFTLIHVNGWNAIHSIGKRTCITAQWEIRAIAKKMAEHIKKAVPDLGEYCEPQCVTYGKCPEKEDCGYYKKRR